MYAWRREQTRWRRFPFSRHPLFAGWPDLRPASELGGVFRRERPTCRGRAQTGRTVDARGQRGQSSRQRRAGLPLSAFTAGSTRPCNRLAANSACGWTISATIKSAGNRRFGPLSSRRAGIRSRASRSLPAASGFRQAAGGPAFACCRFPLPSIARCPKHGSNTGSSIIRSLPPITAP